MACSLVARAWSRRARQHLFSHIRLSIVHSSHRTHSLLRLLKSGSPCTFRQLVHTIELIGFDDPYNTVRHPKRFLQQTLHELAVISAVQELLINHASWGSGVGQAPISSLFPSIRRLSLRNISIYSLAEFTRSISGLLHLEDLDMYVDTPSCFTVDKHEILPPAPPSLRNISCEVRGPAVNQSAIFDWLALTSPPLPLSFLSVNPSRYDIASLYGLLVSAPGTLSELRVRPQFKDVHSEYRSEDSESTGVSQSEMDAFYTAMTKNFRQCNLSMLHHLTISFPLRLWFRCAASNATYMLWLIEHIIGPPSSSDLKTFTICMHSPIPLCGLELLDDAFASSSSGHRVVRGRVSSDNASPVRTYVKFPELRRLVFVCAGVTQGALQELRRHIEKLCPKIAERGLLHVTSEEQHGIREL